MSVVTGVFEGVVVKAGVGKNGKPYKLHSAIVDGKKYSTGFDPVKAAVGDTVSLITATNDAGYENMVEGSFKVVSGATPASAAAATSHAAASNKESDSRQSSIENQSSIASASRIVAAQIGAGVTISDPAQAVASLVKAFLDIIHPKPKAVAVKPKQPQEEDDSDTPY